MINMISGSKNIEFFGHDDDWNLEKIPVEIYDSAKEKNYIALCEEDCQDLIDLEIFQLVNKYRDIFTIGDTTGRPKN